MNLKCPKCGFEQPRDRFCASCGVDMENFKTPNAPLTRRIAGNSFFYVFLAVTVVAATIYFLMKTGQERVFLPDNATSVFQINSSKDEVTPEVLSETAQETISNETTASDGSAEDPNMAGGTNADGAATEGTSLEGAAGLAATREAGAPDGSARGARGGRAFNSVKVTWAEVDSNYFIELFGENLNVGEYRSGLALDEFNNQGFKARWEKGRTDGMIRVLDTSTHSLQPKDSNRIAIKHTSYDARVSQQVGITLTLEPTLIEERGIQMRVQIERALPDVTRVPPAVDTQTANEDVAIPVRAVAYISGFLNRRVPNEDEKRMFASNPTLKLMTSEKFQNRQSELLLFLEPAEGE